MMNDDERLERYDDDDEGIAENPLPEDMLDQQGSDQLDADIEGVRAFEDLYGEDRPEE
jgi:hypothetical protein